MTRLHRVVAAISRSLVRIAGALIGLMVLLITADIGARTLFDAPIRGVPELVSLSIPAIVFLMLAHLFIKQKLIRSDVLLRLLARRSARAAAMLQCVFHLVGALVALGIALPTATAFVDAVATGEFLGVEGDFTVPVWPAKLVIALGAGLLGILCLDAAWASASSVVRWRRAAPQPWDLALAAVAVCGVALAAGVLLRLDGRAAIGLAAIALMFVLIYAGMPVAFALASTAALGIALIKGNPRIAVDTLALVADGAVAEYIFAAVPLFVFMGLVVGTADIGRDSLQAAHWLLRRLKGGLGVATVAANAVFAAITGISIASAAIFSKIAVPPLIEHGFTPRFAVGLVAGSSVLGMLIPPSLLLIVYGLIAEVSISRLFLAAVVPGLILAAAFALGVVLAASAGLRFAVTEAAAHTLDDAIDASAALRKFIPVVTLILIVLGGIYGGIFTPTEAGAIGSLAAAALALAMKRTTIKALGGLTLDAAAGSASILFLIIAASAFAVMLTLSGIPAYLSDRIAGADLGLVSYAIGYLAVLIVLGMILDSTSILLIMVPLALPTIQALGGDLVWFGIISVIGVEIGLLTPPLGLSVYAIKASLDDQSISLNDIFIGALPFTLIMLAVTIVLIVYPGLALTL